MRLLDALVDVPFALPPAVTGITLATLYGPHGWVGAWLAQHGIAIAYTPAGIVLALAFVGLPFVVRTVQPVIATLPREYASQAVASLLGARPADDPAPRNVAARRARVSHGLRARARAHAR